MGGDYDTANPGSTLSFKTRQKSGRSAQYVQRQPDAEKNVVSDAIYLDACYSTVWLPESNRDENEQRERTGRVQARTAREKLAVERKTARLRATKAKTSRKYRRSKFSRRAARIRTRTRFSYRNIKRRAGGARRSGRAFANYPAYGNRLSMQRRREVIKAACAQGVATNRQH